MKMGYISNSTVWKPMPSSLESQACVRALKSAVLPIQLRKEMESFILRNTLPDCGRVPPNCLKAHLVNTAKKLNLPARKVASLTRLFKAKVGFNGYYLDAGQLKRVKLF